MLASEAGAVGVDVGGRLGEHRELEEEGLSGFRAVFTFPGYFLLGWVTKFDEN